MVRPMKAEGLGEGAALPATTAQGPIDPTTMTEVELREAGALVVVAAAGAVVVKATMAAVVVGEGTGISPRMTKVPRKATWEATITTIPAHPKGSTTRTATTTTLLGRNSTIQIRLAVTIWVMAMKVRLRVPFEFLRSDERV